MACDQGGRTMEVGCHSRILDCNDSSSLLLLLESAFFRFRVPLIWWLRQYDRVRRSSWQRQSDLFAHRLF
jgi:hypothetical protein